MNKELSTIFGDAMERFDEVFSLFKHEQVNEVPFEGSWTAAQVVVHILKSQGKLPQLLEGETVAANRDPEAQKDNLKKIFLDFTTKLQSPSFIVPGTELQDQGQLLLAIRERKLAITGAIHANDLSRICLGFELPDLGRLTGAEWTWFAVFHLQRHTRQLQNIYNALSEAAGNIKKDGDD